MQIKWSRAGDERALCPAGTYSGVCVAAYDLGMQNGYQGKPPVRKLALMFELDKTIESGALKGQRYLLGKIVTASLHEKSTLRIMIKSMFDKDPVVCTNGQPDFDVDSLVNLGCTVAVVHEHKAGKTVALVESVSRKIAGTPALTPTFDSSRVPNWIQRIRNEALPDEDDEAAEIHAA